jgi:hypothetical protein
VWYREAEDLRLQVILIKKTGLSLFNVKNSENNRFKPVLTSTRNYAKTHPDLCILAVNTFVQVCQPFRIYVLKSLSSYL